MALMPTFGAARKEASAEPITFMVEGEAEAFTVPRPIPAMPLLEMAADAQDADVGGALLGFMRFLRGCIPEEDWPRFRDAVTRARMGAEDLLPVVQFLVSEATGRPTIPPPLSPDSWPSGGRLPNPEPAANGAGAP
jgi:hypothetical protein